MAVYTRHREDDRKGSHSSVCGLWNMPFLLGRSRARPDAFALARVAVDIRVNQLVPRPTMGLRAVLPTRILH